MAKAKSKTTTAAKRTTKKKAPRKPTPHVVLKAADFVLNKAADLAVGPPSIGSPALDVVLEAADLATASPLIGGKYVYVSGPTLEIPRKQSDSPRSNRVRRLAKKVCPEDWADPDSGDSAIAHKINDWLELDTPESQQERKLGLMNPSTIFRARGKRKKK
jgi:hypothetical protein